MTRSKFISNLKHVTKNEICANSNIEITNDPFFLYSVTF